MQIFRSVRSVDYCRMPTVIKVMAFVQLQFDLCDPKIILWINVEGPFLPNLVFGGMASIKQT